MTRRPGPGAALFAALTGVLALALAWGLAWWALADHLAQTAARDDARRNDGWQWPLADPEALVGERPVGLDATFDDGALVGTVGPRGGYLSLAFGGERIDARIYRDLEIDLTVDRDTTLLLFHRAVLGGPVLSTDPISVSAGTQRLRLRLDERRWIGQPYVGGTPVGAPFRTRWGGRAGTVSSLRIHPATAIGTQFRIDAIRILPVREPGPEDGDAVPWPRVTLGDAVSQTGPVISVPLFRGLPERVLVARRDARAERPAQRWRPSQELPLPPVAIGLAIAAVLFAIGLASRVARAPSWLAGGASALLAGLLGPGGAATAGAGIAGVALLVATGVQVRDRVAPLRWLPSGGWWIVLILPGLVVSLLALAGTLPTLDAVIVRLPRYLPWALLQQALLNLVLVPALSGSRDGHPQGLVAAAGLFALLHAPNFSLSVLTFGLALISGYHFRRHQALLPLALGHALAGAVALAGLPAGWLWNGDVGMRYFAVG